MEEIKNEMSLQQSAPTELMESSVNSFSIFASQNDFQLASRMANMLSQSNIVPKEYQGNISNCMIALEMAVRLKTSPIMVMQNLYIVNGRPSWSSQYIISVINSCGRFESPLKFDMSGSGDSLSCIAWTTQNGQRVESPKVSLEMAKKEGWYGKNGSKWQTMPELMIRYRAAAFFGRIHCPDAIMGLYSQEEEYDRPQIKEAEVSVIFSKEDKNVNEG